MLDIDIVATEMEEQQEARLSRLDQRPATAMEEQREPRLSRMSARQSEILSAETEEQ